MLIAIAGQEDLSGGPPCSQVLVDAVAMRGQQGRPWHPGPCSTQHSTESPPEKMNSSSSSAPTTPSSQPMGPPAYRLTRGPAPERDQGAVVTLDTGYSTEAGHNHRCGFLRDVAGLPYCPMGFVEQHTSCRENIAADPHMPESMILRGGHAGSNKNPPCLQADPWL